MKWNTEDYLDIYEESRYLLDLTTATCELEEIELSLDGTGEKNVYESLLEGQDGEDDYTITDDYIRGFLY